MQVGYIQITVKMDMKVVQQIKNLSRQGIPYEELGDLFGLDPMIVEGVANSERPSAWYNTPDD